jgi:hypothetical protein
MMSKLLPLGDGPFKVLARINNNAYKIELLMIILWATHSILLICLLPLSQRDQSRGRLLFKKGRIMRTYPMVVHKLLLKSMTLAALYNHVLNKTTMSTRGQ